MAMAFAMAEPGHGLSPELVTSQSSVLRTILALALAFGLAIALVLIRGTALFIGGRVGMAIGAVLPEHRKFVPYGLLSQSGVGSGSACSSPSILPAGAIKRRRASSAR